MSFDQTEYRPRARKTSIQLRGTTIKIHRVHDRLQSLKVQESALELGCTTRLGQMDSSSWRTMSQSSMVDNSNLSRKLNRRPYYQPYIAGRWDDPALGGQWVTGGWGNKKPPYVDPDCSQVTAALTICPMTSAPRRLQSVSLLESAHLGI